MKGTFLDKQWLAALIGDIALGGAVCDHATRVHDLANPSAYAGNRSHGTNRFIRTRIYDGSPH